MSGIIYRFDVKPTLEQVTTLYSHCLLGERRPLAETTLFQAMLGNANLVITAWHNDKLIGITRCLTYFVYITYLADLTVDKDYQRKVSANN